MKDQTGDQNDTDKLVDFFRINELIPRDDSEEGKAEEIRISQIKSSLYLDFPFFGKIISQLRTYATSSEMVPTYGCNSRTFYFNTDHTLNKSKKHIKGILAHSAIHLVLDHYNKIEEENEFIFRVAVELQTFHFLEEINDNLFARYHLTGYYSDSFRTWTTDEDEGILETLLLSDYKEIYAKIDYLWRKNTTSKLESLEDHSTFRDQINDLQKSEIMQIVGLKRRCAYWELSKHLTEKLDERAEVEKSRIHGLIKSSLLMIEKKEILPYEVSMELTARYQLNTPWFAVLEKYLQDKVTSDWLWLPPNRRYVNMYLYFPTTKKKVFRVFVGLECFTDIDDEKVDMLLREVYNVLSSNFSFELRVIGFQDEIEFSILLDDSSYSHQLTEINMQETKKPRVGSFDPLFNYIEELQTDPDLLIVFTPNTKKGPAKKPDYQVLWVTLQPAVHNFGDSIVFGNDSVLKSWDYRKRAKVSDDQTRISRKTDEAVKWEEKPLKIFKIDFKEVLTYGLLFTGYISIIYLIYSL